MAAEKKSFRRKMSDAMVDVGAVAKDGKNNFHRYAYTTAAALQSRVRAVLHRHGLAIVGVTLEALEMSSEKNIVVKCRLEIGDCDSDESAVFEGIGQGSDRGDKAAMKANTAATKYAFANAFAATFGEDPEADVEVDRQAYGKKSGASSDQSGVDVIVDAIESSADKNGFIATLKKCGPQLLSLDAQSKKKVLSSMEKVGADFEMTADECIAVFKPAEAAE